MRDDIAFKLSLLFMGGTILVAGIKGCSKLNSNRDNIDTVKEYNAVIDYNEQGTSIAKIASYSDYVGSTTVEYVTSDGLQILTGINNIQLVRAYDYDKVYDLAVELSGGEVSKVVSYDKLQGLSTKIEVYGWNKDLLNLNYDFNYAITETEDGVTVKKITTWKDWDTDDKVQITFEDGTTILTTFTNTKLVNTINTDDSALYNYALSLAGTEDRLFGDIEKPKVKAK